MNKFFGLFIFVLFSIPAFSQEFENLLDDVVIKGNNIAVFEQNWISNPIDSLAILTLNGANLSSLLEQGSIGGLRAKAGVSTVSFRGLLSSHTQLLWNGIALQSPSLGVVDLSTFPSSAYPVARISKGGSSALFGSGALGGTIHLNDEFVLEKGFFVSGGIRMGSFGLLSGDLGMGKGNEKSGFRIKVYASKDKNEFSYKNTAVLGSPEEVQDHASSDFKGLKFSAYQALGKGRLFLHYWFHDNFQELQAPMTSNQVDDTQRSTYQRGMLGYRINKGKHWFDIRAALISDKIDFNERITQTFSGTIKAEFGKELRKNLNLLLGFQQQFQMAKIQEYNGEPVESISAIYFSLNYQPFSIWKLNFSGRQTIWNSNLVPFAPEIQSKLGLMERGTSKLSFVAKGSHNYRLPTLNDQYWDPGGNPNVRPERSWYVESGIVLEKKGKTALSLGILAFYTQVQDLLIWLPLDSVWSNSVNQYISGPAWGVVNQSELESKGIEIRGKIDQDLGNGKSWYFGFTWSPVNSGSDQPTFYVPFQTGIMATGVSIRRFWAKYSLKFTGARPTLTFQKILDPYILQYLETGYEFKNSRLNTNVFLRVDNLADVQYQSYEWYAMPGRKFSLGLNFLIN